MAAKQKMKCLNNVCERVTLNKPHLHVYDKQETFNRNNYHWSAWRSVGNAVLRQAKLKSGS